MPQPIVKSANRAIEVFELFYREKRPLSMKEISQSLGYPASSTMYLLKSLSAAGYLNYNKIHRNYFPTSRLRTLSSWIDGYLPDNAEITDVMRHLRLHFGETVAIGVRNDLNLQYLKAFESDYPLRYNIREGGQRPLIEAAMGWAIMSNLPDSAIESICFRSNQLHGRQVYDFKEVSGRLSKVRQDGYCCLVEPLETYTSVSVGMRLPIQYNSQDIVIGVGGERTRVVPKVPAIVAEMRRALADL